MYGIHGKQHVTDSNIPPVSRLFSHTISSKLKTTVRSNITMSSIKTKPENSSVSSSVIRSIKSVYPRSLSNDLKKKRSESNDKKKRSTSSDVKKKVSLSRLGKPIGDQNLRTFNLRRTKSATIREPFDLFKMVSPKSGARTSRRRTRYLHKQEPKKEIEIPAPVEEIVPFAEIGIQTQESEITNTNLIIGDLKIILPSQNILKEIEIRRETERKKEALRGIRKFEEYAKNQEQHLTNLQEFLDTSAIKKRFRRSSRKPDTEPLIKSMDELLRTDLSIAVEKARKALRNRVYLKEVELLENLEFMNPSKP